MYCPKCGKEIPDGARFCTECGFKIETTAKPTRPPVESVEVYPATQSVAGNPTEEQTATNTKKSGSIVKKWWFWVIIGVVLLLVLSIALAFGTGKRNTKSIPVATQSVTEQKIGGYEPADYERFSSRASDHGLKGTKLYLSGTVKTFGDSDNQLYLIVADENNKEWLVLVTALTGKTYDLDWLERQPVSIFGVYQGYSDDFEMPALILDRMAYNGKDYEPGSFVTDKPTEAAKPTAAPTRKPKPTAAPTEAPADNVSQEYKNALKSAQSYSDHMHMSKQGIFDQLTSEYGNKFPEDAAQYAIDNVDADWEYNALKKAESYSSNMHMSKQGIYDQLISEYGEQFTESEAQYAIDHVEADWNENALKKAESYYRDLNMSVQAVYDQLISEYGEKFTDSEAQYAIDHLE